MTNKRINKHIVTILAVVIVALTFTMLFAACREKTGQAEISKIEVTTLPSKTTYSIGESFSVEGGVLTVYYTDNTTKTVSLTDKSIELGSLSTLTPGTKEVTVTYQGKQTTFSVTVSEQPVASIAISNLPAKTEYVTGQKFSADGGVIKIVYEDGGEREISLSSEGVTLSEPDMSTAGDKVITVTYGGKSTTFTINVADAGEQKPVGRIAVKTNPDKMDYIAGDAFDPTGGVLLVTYTDKTTEEVPFTDRRVTFDAFDMGTEDMTESVQRTITIRFGNKRTTCKIGISAIGGRVTFDTLCEDVDNLVVKVAKGSYAVAPETLVRSGYTFYKWYEDKDCTVEYEFSTTNIVNKDVTVYAQWKENGATYHDVTFSYNYYGQRRSEFTQIVKDGENARPIANPTRDEFSFDGWFTNEALTAAFNAATSIKEDTTVRAKWTKRKTGSSEYVFEAEDTDLTGKTGPGFSGAANDAGMIVEKKELGASAGRAVSYLYQKNNSLEFYIASSEATTATLKVRMASEFEGTITLNQGNFLILVNGESQSYSVTLKGDDAFVDVEIGNVALKEGYNLIRVVTNNDKNPLGDGNGTYAGTAPMIDCIKLETTAVLAWDGNYGLPKAY